MKKIIIVLLIFILSFFLISANSKEQATVYKSISTEEKIIALTFDDGPHPRQTLEILNILKKHNVKATFFVVGQNVEYYPNVIKQVNADGHEIGNHTYSHLNLRNASKTEIINEIKKGDDCLKKYSEKKVKLLRPPGGALNANIKNIANEFDYKIILWNIDTRDWAHTDCNTIKDNIEKNIKNGSIILFHDYILSPTPTPEALEMIIPALKKQGYSFVTVSELLDYDNPPDF